MKLQNFGNALFCLCSIAILQTLQTKRIINLGPAEKVDDKIKMAIDDELHKIINLWNTNLSKFDEQFVMAKGDFVNNSVF